MRKGSREDRQKSEDTGARIGTVQPSAGTGKVLAAKHRAMQQKIGIRGVAERLARRVSITI